MDTTLIRRLNELNRVFYQQHATSFSGARSYYWQGWNKLVPYIQQLAETYDNQVTVMDVGCGNGRFGAFLAGQLPEVEFTYIGLDNSRELLKIAKTHEVMNYIDAHFIELDVVESLLDGSFATKIQPFQPHLISALGVLHHIPSHQLRQQFILQMGEAVSEPGFVVFTTWNFLNNKRFQKKIMDPEQFDLNPTDLEADDVILNWQRGETAYRYCHHTDRDELKKLIEATSLVKTSGFQADGKSNKLNTYTVLQK